MLRAIPIESLLDSPKRLGETKVSTTGSMMDGGQHFWYQGLGQRYLQHGSTALLTPSNSRVAVGIVSKETAAASVRN